MSFISRTIHFFRSLRGKLIVTYTLVTVLALVALEASILILILFFTSSQSVDRGGYLSDVVSVLYPQAQFYLQPGSEDIPGLQSWLASVYATGRASLPAQDLFDSPEAKIVKDSTMLVLSPEGTILAQAPDQGNYKIGQAYTLPSDVEANSRIMDNALRRDFNSLDLYAVQPDGTYLMAVPVPQESRSTRLVGVILVAVQPAPPMASNLWLVFLSIILVTAGILVMAVAPFGALFGFIMSRGLTRRLQSLTLAADAWSEGNFSIQPQDKSRDEISYLGMRMRHMAERVQTLLQTQQELAMLEERNRLARDLHDTVKQQTFATLMQVRAAKNLLAAEPATARQRLDEAEDLIKASQQELSLMIAELRPAALEGQGLVEALETYLGTWSKHACIPADFRTQNGRRLPLEIELTLYRVAQEALANVARHSRASTVTVSLVFAQRQVILSVADNGVGFNVGMKQSLGFGLQSMRDRLASSGGTLSIESSTEKGTTVTATIKDILE